MCSGRRAPEQKHNNDFASHRGAAATKFDRKSRASAGNRRVVRLADLVPVVGKYPKGGYPGIRSFVAVESPKARRLSRRLGKSKREQLVHRRLTRQRRSPIAAGMLGW